METNGNGRIKYEHRLTSLEKDVGTILNNHLPHLQKAVDANGRRTWYILVAVILGILIQIAFNTL